MQQVAMYAQKYVTMPFRYAVRLTANPSSHRKE